MNFVHLFTCRLIPSQFMDCIVNQKQWSNTTKSKCLINHYVWPLPGVDLGVLRRDINYMLLWRKLTQRVVMHNILEGSLFFHSPPSRFNTSCGGQDDAALFELLLNMSNKVSSKNEIESSHSFQIHFSPVLFARIILEQYILHHNLLPANMSESNLIRVHSRKNA